MLFVALAGLLLIIVLSLRVTHVPIRHRWRRRQVRTMWEQLRGPHRDQPPARVFARVRAMDALGFDGLLLTSFERRGHNVIRSHRYTGDGGVDGSVVLHDRVWLIQAKRYTSAIRPDHVQSFAALCVRQARHGWFIHTGRTGTMSRVSLTGAPDVEIISGDRLIALLTDRALSIGGRSV